MAGVNLVRRCARTTAQTPGGAVVAEVAVEVESDRRTLERAMTALSVPASAPKSAGAWLAEKLGRLKPNGRARAGGSMQALHELEMLSLGLTGKRALWTALQALPGLADRANLDLVALTARAQDQFDRIEAVRLNEVRASFTPVTVFPDERREDERLAYPESGVVLMSDLSAEERLVRAFLRARDCRDYASAVALIAKDCVWHSPINGPVQGRVRVREMLESAEEDTAWFESQLYGFERRSGRVLARVRNQAERDGKSLDSTQLLAFVVPRDKISEIRIFVDDPEAVKDFWAD